MPPAITLERLDRDHHTVLAELRSTGAVVWVEALGAWVVLDRAVAIEVLRDAGRFTVDDPRFATAQVVGPSMLSLDGPEHRRHRDPFVAAFRPAVVVARLAPRVAAEAVALVDRIRPAGRADLVAAVAGPLAARTAAMALGLDDVDAATLLGWYRRIVAATEERSIGGAVGAALDATAAAAMAALRGAVVDAAARPDAPLAPVAALLDADEVVANAAVFLFGAIETTEGTIANLVRQLLVDPELRDAVRRDPALRDVAIEESLRHEPAVTRVDRYATCDVELAGGSIRTGDFVVVSLAAANRDPAVYDDPHTFRLDREHAPGHLTFVHGPHACIGAQLARVETRAALDALLDGLPGLEPDVPDGRAADRPAVPEPEGIVFRKPRSLPARWR